MKLIGVGGTNGSGKDSLAEFLQDKHGWLFISLSDVLRDELKRRGIPIERQNLHDLSTEWRRQFGGGILIDKAFKIYETKEGQYKGIVVASLRHPAEAEEVHRLGGQIVWVDADPAVRYQRIYSRARSVEDKKTFEQFLAEEQAEMSHSGDHHTLNMSAVKAQADIFIQNDQDNLEGFTKKIETALAEFLTA